MRTTLLLIVLTLACAGTAAAADATDTGAAGTAPLALESTVAPAARCEAPPASAPFLAAATQSALTLEACTERYQMCTAACWLSCQDAPIPEVCYAACEYGCSTNLAACVAIVVAIGVL